mgnify:CR=1 FL=1|tara:strand:- start:4045 stop:5142 length:1098 start_codon:yes stop_codon:yes gene_type:complete
MGTRTKNYKKRVGKWKPYMNKPFYLGTAMNNDGEDGGNYIWDPPARTQPTMRAYCDDETNAHCCYKIRFVVNAGGVGFEVTKWEIDTFGTFGGELINASSTSGDGRYWEVKDTSPGTSSRGPWITIDVGVHIQFEGDVSDYSLTDYYMVRMPDCKKNEAGSVFDEPGSEADMNSMRKRRFYFGGLHTYLQLPPTEGDAFHSDIIPASLEGKSITCLFGKVFSNDRDSANWQDTLRGCFSMADDTGNSAVSMFLEYSVDKDAANSANAEANTYTWGSGEEWPLGTMIVNDIDPAQIATPIDRVSYTTIPVVDAIPSLYTTGTTQVLNVTTFGKAGYARVKTCFQTSNGITTIMAHNQYWPCTLIIN